MASLTEEFVEQAVVLGRRKSLIGVTTQQNSASKTGRLPMVVILNAGIIHRVGPNRMSVKLARAFAAAGLSTLRFDLSGIGDSAARSDGLGPLQAALADIREVLDELEASRGIDRFVLLGLCSGANHAALYGGSDPRVVGMVLLDPSVPRTRKFYVNHYGRRLLSIRAWLNLIRGRHPVWQSLRISGAGNGEVEPRSWRPSLESREVRLFLEGEYAKSLRRRNQILAIFTAGQEARHNYREQILDAFPNLSFGTQLTLEYFKNADHEFTSEREQAHLIRRVVDWMKAANFRSRDPQVQEDPEAHESVA